MADRYESTKVFRDRTPGPRRYESTLYPQFPKRNSDRYVIAQANGMGKGSMVIPAGKQIRIPFPIHDLYLKIKETREER